MTEIQYKNQKINRKKLLSFGFEEADGNYLYHTDLVGGQMTLTVKIAADGKAYTAVTDNAAQEEYTLHLVEGAAGAFVGQVKGEYEAVLAEISEKCFDAQVFKSDRTKEVIAYAYNRYRDEPEYLWQKFPDNAVLRRKDNQKWYAALLTVSRRKLGFDSDEKVEIIDLRMPPEEIEQKVDGVRLLPGYHMNKKHWISICLDGTLSMEEIERAIDRSYTLAVK